MDKRKLTKENIILLSEGHSDDCCIGLGAKACDCHLWPLLEDIGVQLAQLFIVKAKELAKLRKNAKEAADILEVNVPRLMKYIQQLENVVADQKRQLEYGDIPF